MRASLSPSAASSFASRPPRASAASTASVDAVRAQLDESIQRERNLEAEVERLKALVDSTLAAGPLIKMEDTEDDEDDDEDDAPVPAETLKKISPATEIREGKEKSPSSVAFMVSGLSTAFFFPESN